MLPPWMAGSSQDMGLEMVTPSKPGGNTWTPVKSTPPQQSMMYMGPAADCTQGQFMGAMFIPMMVPVEAWPTDDTMSQCYMEGQSCTEGLSSSSAGPAPQETDSVQQLMQERMQLFQALDPEVQKKILSSATPEQYED